MPSNGTINPSDSRYSPPRFRCLIRTSCHPSQSPYRVSSTGLFVSRNMPPLPPRKIPRAASVLQTRVFGLPHVSTGSASPLQFNEATCRFTFVTACCFANWKLTTPCYQNAASLNYRGERITPRTGLQPVRHSAVTANGQIFIIEFMGGFGIHDNFIK